MSRFAQMQAAAGFLFLALLLAALTLLDIYGDKIMKRVLRVAAVMAVCLPIVACATPVTDLVKAANELDPECGKLVDVRIGTNWIFGWPVPVVTGTYTKACKPEKLKAVAPVPAATPGGLVLGQPVG